jgi:hypothetical protein
MSDYAKTFLPMYQGNLWGGRESKSGNGSDLVETEVIREEIPKLVELLDAKSILDIPCGDMNWMHWIIDGMNVAYIGADVVPEIIADNKQKYPHLQFQVLNIVTDKLPDVDLVLVRDLFGHIPNKDIKAALRNILASGSHWLLTTTFPKVKENTDIEIGSWRPVNMELELGPPKTLLLENFDGMLLGFWEMNIE